jgi:hypothetical protein
MIRDNLNTFCAAEALNTGGAGSYLIGDVYDIETLRDMGQGVGLYLVITMAVTATSGGSATGKFALVSDAQAAITPGTATVHVESPEFAVADMSAGTNILTVALPWQGNTYERYIGIVQTTGTAAFTAGAINAFLTPTPQANVAYPDYSGV